MEVSQLTEFSDQVIKAVELASNEVMDIYNSESFIVEDKSDGSPVTIADKKSHEVLFSCLTSIDSSIPVLSEEGDSQDGSLEKFWLIDPLDGTKEFINKNGEFTVNVALIEKGKPILGVVSAPAICETFMGFAGAAYKIVNEDKISISSQEQSQGHCLVTVSKSHKSEKDQLFIDLCREKFKSVEELPTGSSLKLCRVAEGRANIYSRLGPTYQWDIAAGQAVVEASGGIVSDLSGKPLQYEFISEKKNPLFFCSGDPTYPWKILFEELF
mgnify:FL=1